MNNLRMNFQRVLHLKVPMLLILALYLSVVHLSASAQSAQLEDLSPDGWQRNTDQLENKVDSYQSPTGRYKIELTGFSPSEQSAKQWLDTALKSPLNIRRKAGQKITVTDDDSLGTEYAKGKMNTSADGVDIATRTVIITALGDNKPRLTSVARAIIRPGQPVQFSLLSVQGGNPNKVELKQASQIRFNANMPFSRGETPLIELLHLALEVGAFFNRADVIPESNPLSKPVSKPASNSQSASAHTNPLYAPGTRLEITGEMFDGVPNGYRIHAKTTNYHTNKAMTFTRKTFLTLTSDGQFEWGSFAIGGGGLVGSTPSVAVSSDKHGSTGFVGGSSNPGGPGVVSNSIIERKGLDPSKYGAYHIVGNEMTFTYANGDVEKKSFKTDGYQELLIGDKRFFIDTPTGWVRTNGDIVTTYNSIDGRFTARVLDIEHKRSSCQKWVESFLKRVDDNKQLISHEPIQVLEGKTRSYVVGTVKLVRNKNGGPHINQEVFIKCGRNSPWVFIDMIRLTGDTRNKKIMDFILSVD